MTAPIDETEQAWRDKAKRRARSKKSGISHADMAAGCLTCFCGAWPDVHFWNVKKKSEQYWSFTCPNCYVIGAHFIQTATRAEGVALWNEKHKRLT